MEGNRVCRHFARTGSCPFKRCKFQHVQSPNHNVNPEARDSRPKRPPLSDSEKQFRAWKTSMSTANSAARFSRTRTDTHFQDARRFIEVDPGLMQGVIRELAEEPGLACIRELVEEKFPKADPRLKGDIFKSQVLPLLETVSHPKVLSSLVLEQSVGTIFNVLFGINGTRAALLLSSICDVLLASNKDEAAAEWMEVSLLVFAKIVDFNSTAFVQDSLKDQANRFQEIFLQMNKNGMEDLLHHSRHHLEHILRRLEIGSLLPTALPDSNDKREAKPAVSFRIHREPPGGRHDNDHADIGRIAIMPTLEEIQSSCAEYLPVNDPSQWHIDGLGGLMDRNFRLLREDAIGQLRDAIHQELKGPHRQGTRTNQLRTHVYHHAKIGQVHFDKFAGFQFDVQFPQPPRVREMSTKDRENWWCLPKRLQSGALVCLIIPGRIRQTVVFCTTVDDQIRPAKKKVEQGKDDKKNETSLWMDAKKASVRLAPVDTRARNVRAILNEVLNKKDFSIVEFPGTLLAGFEPTLRALQSIKETKQLPFLDILVPDDSTGPADIPPPLYALRPGFSFNLRCLMKNNADLHVRPNQPADLESLQEHSDLDRAQAVALVHSLQHRIGLIQGPPGTGKSFTGVALIRVLLANRKERQGKTDLGPVLCVTYTNHALDQLLEALIDKGVTSQIIRIGSQSKSERLQELNLRHIARNAAKTKNERGDQYHLHGELEECQRGFSALKINQDLIATHLVTHLKEHYPHRYMELFGIDDDGWETSHRGQPLNVLRRWVQSGKPGNGKIRPYEVLMSMNPIEMSKPEREAFHNILIKEVIGQVHGKATQICSAHYKAKSKFDNVRDEADLRCLSTADVIGVTTSGLARNLNMLRKLQSKVLICEEAGEVLEAHLLTALLPSVEHVILIGDHFQLRPQVQNYDLSRENPRGGEQYSLDVSLFERLVEPNSAMGLGLPFCTLETQRRMHPSIAQLVRDTLYPQLKDAGLVSEYPEVVGMRKRLFWLDHRKPEADTAVAQSGLMATSHWNQYEIDMTLAVVNHLIRQGQYRSGEIAVLTPYLGQLHRLRQLLSQSFTVTHGERDVDQLETAGFEVGEKPGDTTARATLLETLRVATVDNFQGEEAKVVVISLVRSNPQNRCGFLRTSNRINVLLSRAQHGMYIIGNSETSAHVPMWSQALEILRQSDNIGPKLELQCPRHPDTPISVSEPEHFLQLSPEGGCNMRCINRLSCGHACEQRCHSQMLHDAVYCPQPCPRPRQGCTHPCVKRCGDLCPIKCLVKVHKKGRVLQCGHSMPTLPCWQDQKPSTVQCMVRVTKTIEHCQHKVTVKCHQDVKPPAYRCIAQCGAFLPCGHTCKRQCHLCRRVLDRRDIRVDHGRCQQKCGRKHSTCSHFCAVACHGDQPCPPCEEPCAVRCGHSKCTRKCREPCTPCAEGECFSKCPHSSCSMPCAAPCNHIPCSKRCDKRLGCGHQCPSVCGEQCPSEKYCQICGGDDVKHQVVDFIMGETYADINLDENPCIFPACGHFLTMESMDGQMDLRQHYEADGEGRPVSIKNASYPFSMDDIKTCATCRGPLRDIARYGRLVRRALLDESTKKLILYVNQEYVPLEEELARQVQQLQGKEIKAARNWPGHIKIDGSVHEHVKRMAKIIHESSPARWKEIIKLRDRVVAYRKQVALDEQPYNRVRNMVENAMRRKPTDDGFGFDFDDAVLQTKGVLLASALCLRLDLALLSDFLTVHDRVSQAGSITIDLDLHRTKDECSKLIDLARESHRILQQAEGYLFLAQMYALERSRISDPVVAETHTKEGHAAIAQARALCSEYPAQTKGLPREIDGAEKMLRESTFYAIVTNEERMAVVSAMAREFHGTGHWYYCRNGHPFTIGECGGAMQQSSCPDCGAPVGGRNHQVVEGVTRADDLEEPLGRMRL